MILRIFETAAHSLAAYVAAGLIFGALTMVPLAVPKYPDKKLSTGGLAGAALLLLFLAWLSQGHVTFQPHGGLQP